METMSSPNTVDTKAISNPFKGPKSYEEIDKYNFYGREEEIAELFQLIRMNTLTILYSQSGIGKSSLLRAGIMPVLRIHDYLPIYIRPNYSDPALDLETFIVDQIAVAIEKMPTQGEAFAYSHYKPRQEETLYEYFDRSPFFKFIPNENGREADIFPLVPVLIFDQFEEIFTIGANNTNVYQFLQEELSNLIEKNIPVRLMEKLDAQDPEQREIKWLHYINSLHQFRVVFALREEYLSHLDSLSAFIPSVASTTSRLRLTPFTQKTAEGIILKISNYRFDEELSRCIVTLIRGDTADKQPRKKNEVEPFLLSLICFHLYSKIIIKLDETTLQQIEAVDYQLVDQILNDYYDEAMAEMPSAVRKFVEEDLLTDKGNRTLYDCEDAERKIGQQYIEALVNEFRLLRKEEFLNSQHLEIIHDRVTPIIIQSRHIRRVQEKAEELQRETERQLEESRILLEEERKKQEEENARKLLDAEKNNAEAYRQKVKDLENEITVLTEHKIAEVRSQLENELSRQYQVEFSNTRISYENRLADMEANREKLVENRLGELKQEYARRIQELQERIDRERREVELTKEEYGSRMRDLEDKMKFEKSEVEKAKADRNDYERKYVYDTAMLRGRVKNRTLVTYILAGLTVLSVGFYVNYLIRSNTQLTNLDEDNRMLTDSIRNIKTNYMQMASTGRSGLMDSLNAYRNEATGLRDSLSLLRSMLATASGKSQNNNLLAMTEQYNQLKITLDNRNRSIDSFQREQKTHVTNYYNTMEDIIDLKKIISSGSSKYDSIDVITSDIKLILSSSRTALKELQKIIYTNDNKLRTQLNSDEVRSIDSRLQAISEQCVDLENVSRNLTPFRNIDNFLRDIMDNLQRIWNKISYNGSPG